MKLKDISNKTIVAICLFFICQSTFGQENYLPGYIVKINGDTLHGYIDYRNWVVNPDKISFKKNLDNTYTSYSPIIDIKSFSVLDELYESAIIKVETSPTRLNQLETNSDLNFEIDTTFLQTIIKGEKSLYFYKSALMKELFYIKTDLDFEILIYKKYLKEFEEKKDATLAVENKKFIGQLIIYLENCPTIQSNFENTNYSKKSLEKLFLNYYNCIGLETEFQKRKEKLSLKIGLLGGLSVTNLNFKTNSNYFSGLNHTNYGKSINPTLGLFLNLILPRNQKKWSISNELIYTSYKLDGVYNEYENKDIYSSQYTSLGYSSLKMNNMLRYKHPVGKHFLFLNTGISISYNFNETNYSKKESQFYTTNTNEEGKALEDTKKNELGYFIGIGTDFKLFSLEYRYERGNGMSPYPILASKTIRNYFLIGYRF